MRQLLVLGATAAVLAAGCAAAPATAPTTCGGGHDWPPNGYAATPAGVSVELVSGLTVRLANATQRAWAYRASAWGDAPCAGWISYESALRGSVPADGTADVAVSDPQTGQPIRLGVEFWDHPCGEACTDAPIGFGWVDGPAPAPTSAPSAASPPASAAADVTPLPTGGISRDQAIALARSHVAADMSFADASAGPWAMFAQNPSGVAEPSPPDRLVWAVRYTGEFTICPPVGTCWSPRPGTTTVILDYWTGGFLGTQAFSPSSQ